MRNILFAALFFTVFCGCAGGGHKADSHHHAHPVVETTVYTSDFELFVQHDELIEGHTASVVAYITLLPSFKPYEGEAIDVSLRAGDNEFSTRVEAVNKGVYEFSIMPTAEADGCLLFYVAGQEIAVNVSVEGHRHTHEHEAHAHSDEEMSHARDNYISFGKELGWKIDFATALAQKSSFGWAVRVAAQVTSTPDNFTTLVAASAGKVCYSGNLVVGKAVQAGETLFLLESGNVAENDAVVKFTETESEFMVAKSEYERKSGLYADDIVSKREYEAAEAAYARAEAKYLSVKRSFAQGDVAVKSSMAGYLSDLLVSNGDYVQAGTPLAVIQRNGNMNISAELPVRYAAMLKNVANVNIELSDGKIYTMSETDARITVGTAANSCSMLPLTVTAKYVGDMVPGSIVTLHISSLSRDARCVSVPRTALVEEMGNYFVFVQHTPILFEKREVALGATDGAVVQILSGVEEGERVVVKGGVSLKLSQGVAALDPHAGHVH